MSTEQIDLVAENRALRLHAETLEVQVAWCRNNILPVFDSHLESLRKVRELEAPKSEHDRRSLADKKALEVIDGQRIRIASLEQELLQAAAQIEGAVERMDRARNILTNGQPTPNCNWGMLDTSDLSTSSQAVNAVKAEALRKAAVKLQPTDYFAHVELNRMADELEEKP
jgi:hypothetical protein